jgi:hypothetical protein
MTPDAERLMELHEAVVQVALRYSPVGLENTAAFNEASTAFREALFAAFQPDAGALADAQKKARALVDNWWLGLGQDERVTPLSQLRLIERVTALLLGEK